MYVYLSYTISFFNYKISFFNYHINDIKIFNCTRLPLSLSLIFNYYINHQFKYLKVFNSWVFLSPFTLHRVSLICNYYINHLSYSKLFNFTRFSLSTSTQLRDSLSTSSLAAMYHQNIGIHH